MIVQPPAQVVQEGEQIPAVGRCDPANRQPEGNVLRQGAEDERMLGAHVGGEGREQQFLLLLEVAANLRFPGRPEARNRRGNRFVAGAGAAQVTRDDERVVVIARERLEFGSAFQSAGARGCGRMEGRFPFAR